MLLTLGQIVKVSEMKRIKVNYTIDGYPKFAKGVLIEENKEFYIIKLASGGKLLVRKDKTNEVIMGREGDEHD